MERAVSVMPGAGKLEHLADQLRRAVTPALAFAQVPTALRLLALADEIAKEVDSD